jgi:5-methyltetrahydropteroyltriglutamate--homocysteine methyltransferase
MKRSIDQILTTHTGSLPRPDDLADLHIAKAKGEALDEATFEQRVRDAVEEAVSLQVDAGVSVVSDGEMSKYGYIEYTGERLEGYGGGQDLKELQYYIGDMVDFPELLYATYKDSYIMLPSCQGPLRYVGHDLVARDIHNFELALKSHPATEAFIPAASPGVVTMFCPNEYYPTYDEYVMALAEALNAEYRAITGAGFVLQIDAPDLAFGSDFHTWMWDQTEERGFPAIQELHIEAINVALQGVPREQVRLHLCWANYQGPHTHDQPLADVLRATFKANVGAVLFESANPAHAHEWETFKTLRVPDEIVLIPGVIDSKSQVVEHPRLVAQRIKQYAEVVGKERVIAGVDCGFGTFVGVLMVRPRIAWMKLKNLAEGAAIATDELARGV